VAIDHFKYCILSVFLIEFLRRTTSAVLLVETELDLIAYFITSCFLAVLICLLFLFLLGFSYIGLS
jgi:hypothetical protein